jgi:hypothetical protein
VKIAVVARPGADRGSAILRKAPVTPAPSMYAASSSERGTPSKNARIIQITRERLNVR